MSETEKKLDEVEDNETAEPTEDTSIVETSDIDESTDYEDDYDDEDEDDDGLGILPILAVSTIVGAVGVVAYKLAAPKVKAFINNAKKKAVAGALGKMSDEDRVDIVNKVYADEGNDEDEKEN